MIEINNIEKNYYRGKKKNEVLKNCNLIVEKGEFLVIMGPSGSGKSTLLNIIGGIDQAESGDIVINGKSMKGMSEKELTLYRRSEVGIIFQFFNLIPNLTAIENISLPLLLGGKNYSKATLEAEKYLDMVKLSGKGDRKPEELSGGEMQRVAIARALINQPAVILADEPTGNLDSGTTDEVITLLKSISEKIDQTVIMVTHNENLANIGDRIIHIIDGQIIDQ